MQQRNRYISIRSAGGPFSPAGFVLTCNGCLNREEKTEAKEQLNDRLDGYYSPRRSVPGPPEKERAYQGELATTAVKESGAERHPDQTAQQHTGTEDEKILSRPLRLAVPVA